MFWYTIDTWFLTNRDSMNRTKSDCDDTTEDANCESESDKLKI